MPDEDEVEGEDKQGTQRDDFTPVSGTTMHSHGIGEGAMLLGLYIIIAVAFFVTPSGALDKFGP